MDDLFKLFPDLPRLPRRSVEESVRGMRQKAERVRRRVVQSADERRALIKRQRQEWLERTRRRR